MNYSTFEEFLLEFDFVIEYNSPRFARKRVKRQITRVVVGRVILNAPLAAAFGSRYVKA